MLNVIKCNDGYVCEFDKGEDNILAGIIDIFVNLETKVLSFTCFYDDAIKNFDGKVLDISS